MSEPAPAAAKAAGAFLDADPAATDGFLAPAKINLSLHVTGRRPDGYHLLDSLVVFAGVGDHIRAERAGRTSLSIDGAFAAGLAADGDNLVLRAAALMAGCPVSLHLTKSLPVAAGIGGGSADAAATLRAIAAVWNTDLPAADAILGLGADVPVCLDPGPARMRGIGDDVARLPALPPVWCVLANPLVACPTGPIFAALTSTKNPPPPPLPERFADMASLAAWLAETRNDLEPAAVGLLPIIGTVKAALAAQPDCALARMSGSGATVFGLFEDATPALAAATALRSAHPGWWVVAAPVL